MIAVVREKALCLKLHKVRAELRDFIAEGAGVAAGSQVHAMIFNLLHLAQPVALLREVYRTLHNGVLWVMHWRRDIPTRRGPPPETRPPPGNVGIGYKTRDFVRLHRSSCEMPVRFISPWLADAEATTRAVDTESLVDVARWALARYKPLVVAENRG